MRVGFSGTRHGMSHAQKRGVISVLAEIGPATQYHAGCCVGADEEFTVIVSVYSHDYAIVGHPSALKQLTSKVCADFCNLVFPAKPPLERNRDIVEATDVLVAAPETAEEQLRSGTWATIRYARKLGRPVYLVMPDGSVRKENVPG